MGQIGYQNLQIAAIKLSKSQFLKKSIQLLLKLFIFSFLFSYFSWPTIFLHSINLYSSSTCFPHQTIDRNYMFLVCIGILVFLARNSGLIGSSPFHTDLIKDEFSEPDVGSQSRIEFSEMNYYVEKEEEEEDEVENVLLITQGEEEEEENHELLSGEELKKKFDDFIKKMKENIRIESQQLIMVHGFS